ncbi:MAG: hypothetical protein JO082_00495 [Mycobacterium sp.]|nr:hypothetical protein [Mycobacterium sp.]MBV9720384.1 hypothetical protein [Mycobacterium sp.]
MSTLSDSQIAAMSPADRRQLIERLERPLEEVLPVEQVHRLRWGWLGMMIGGTLVLIPWIVYLAFVLPDSYLVHGWTMTWVGFDVLLAALMAATVVLGMLRRQLMLLTAFATGVLLICDAWFDLMTAGPDDFWVSVLTAALADLPVAVLLIAGTLRLVQLTAIRMWLIEPATPLWRLPLMT